MKRSTFQIDQMDCPVEEQLIRRRLERMEGVDSLRFDLMARRLTVQHRLADDQSLFVALESLGMAPRREEVATPTDHGGAAAEWETVLHAPGMCCPTESEMIRGRLGKLPGVLAVTANTMERQVVVRLVRGSAADRLANEGLLLSELRALGMDAEVKEHGESTATRKAVGSSPRASWLGVALLAASGILAFSSELVAWSTGHEQSPVVIALAVLSILLGGRETLRKGWLALRNFTLNINFLMSLAVLGAVVIGQWPEAAMVTFLFALAEKIEAGSLDRARNAIRSLMALSPETASVRDGQGAWHEVEAAAVVVGQLVRVRPGERIPLDGLVTGGRSTVNQAPITGESLPVEKGPGDTVFAGTVNERGTFEFNVTAGKGDTTLDRIVRAVQEAQADRAPTQRSVDQFARWYTPAVVLFALLVAVVPPLALGQPWGVWVYRALVMLVIACPCALVLSTPVTVVSGLAAAARNGILVKGGAYLEQGRNLRVVALDKTGTLTHGRPIVTDVIPLDGISEAELLHLAASLNAHSEHPVASAIVRRCETAHGESRCHPIPVADFEALAGRGVRGMIGGEPHFIGSHRLAHDNNVCSPAVEVILDRLEAEGKTTVVITDGRRSLGVIAVADTVRETSVTAIRELHDLGVRTVMLTGDNPRTAQAIATNLGIEDVRGELLPEDKLAVIEALRKQFGGKGGGIVGMVGDGINDAPALARADIGFAMGAAGTDTALETADVALMDDDLRRLPQFIRLSRATGQVLGQNIALALGIKLLFFGLALGGVATLWMAVFADMGGSLLVVFNGLRLLRFGRKRGSEGATLA